ncbi:hypothetical protein M5C72_07240 [Companilactobacillus allii]|uniref:Lipoprotein n=1 Tax=Companilactobacillus allii TaxID=1847728 RepID=A0A1P8Q4V7_9LACO|nr:hypothetical protein [Companilactobacillus allii]APX72892.1 hypothetical protein BTM29_10155 [Companilactobacillus allii]USQ67680.1 hypothetical protein M5C72_07240 [Companilactobacillus allii]
MKEFKRILTTLILIALTLIAAGCSYKSANSSENKYNYSKKELINFYADAGNGQANIIYSYAKSIDTNSDHVSKVADNQVALLTSNNKKLKQNRSNTEATKNLISFNNSLKTIAMEYKNNDFSHSKNTNKRFNKQVALVKSDL